MRTMILVAVVIVLLIAPFPTTMAQGVDPGTANLTHSWNFNDGTAKDVVGHADGTLEGAAELYGGSLLTVNPSSWLSLPADQIAISDYPEVTITCWFQSVTNGNTAYTMLAWFGNTQNTVGVDGYFITVARGDDKSRAAISCGVYTNPWSGESGANGPEYDDGNLHFVASTLSADSVTLYIDGVEQQSTKLSATNNIALLSNAEAYLAKSGYNGDSTWMGEILEFNMYNKALSANEILFLNNKGAATGIENSPNAIPKDFQMSQNYPNPFNPTTTITFSLPRRSPVHLEVVNMLGQVVKVLAEGDFDAGVHSVKLDASHMASGVYFYRLQAEHFVDVKKLMLVK